MTMCPYCDTVYDESDYTRCPKCYPPDEDDKIGTYHIVYDEDQGRALELSDSEYKEFKKTHKGYH